MYYLTVTARRKGAKRHIVDSSTNVDILIDLAKNNMNHHQYIVEVYNGRWGLVYSYDKEGIL